MNFERLPENIFLDILGYLPLTKRIRAKSVSKLWYDRCTLAIQERPVSFDFFRDFKTIPEVEFRRLMQVCHRSVKKMFFDDRMGRERNALLLSILAEFIYPKLTVLYIDPLTSDLADLFCPLISSAPNLKMLLTRSLDDDFLARLPDGSCSMLEELYIFPCGLGAVTTSATFRFLGQSCKNLKILAALWNFRTISDGGGQAEIEDMNYFFNECAQLRKIYYNSTDIFARAPNFWKLKMLEDIQFRGFEVDDQFLHSLSGSFPLITRLRLTLADGVTGPGVGCLSHMQNLQHLEVYGKRSAPLLLKDEFNTLVNNIGGLKHLQLRSIFTDAARLKEAAIVFANREAFLCAGISDTVENIMPFFEHLLKAGISFECECLDDTSMHGRVYRHSSISTLMSALNNLEANSNTMWVWTSGKSSS